MVLNQTTVLTRISLLYFTATVLRSCTPKGST